jgi:hypothetical protein
MPAVSISHHEARRSQKQAPQVPRLLWPGNPLRVSTCSSCELFLLSCNRSSGAYRGNPTSTTRAGQRLDAGLLELGWDQVCLGTGAIRRAAVPGGNLGGRKMGA